MKRDLIASVMAVAVGLRGRKGGVGREGEEGKPALLPSDRVPTVVDALVLKLKGRRFRKAVHFRGHCRKRDTRGRQEEVREPGNVGGRGRGGTARLDISTYIAWPRRGGSPRSASRWSLLAPVREEMVEGERGSVPVCSTTRRHARSHPCLIAQHEQQPYTYLGALAAGDALDERVNHG